MRGFRKESEKGIAMIALYITLGVLCALLLLYLFLLTTRRRRPATEKFMRVPYAHRGLHGGNIPENSLAAFSAACDGGFGIELDVQLSSDGEVMVFHDESLLRMTGCDASLYGKSLSELKSLRLQGSEERIPTLTEVLSLVNGRVPILVEIKSDHAVMEVCRKTAALLDGYTGAYMVESFHPLAVNWFRKNRESVVRGQLSARLFVKGKRTLSMLLVQNLLLNFLARPDFVAYDYRARRALSFSLCRLLYRPYTVAWTVTDAAGLHASRKFDGVIFEKLTREELARACRPIKSSEDISL